MKQFSEETRKRMSESAKKRCNAEWRSNRSSLYETKLDTEQIRKLYESGMTQLEIANELGVSQKTIHGHMRRHGIQTRKAAKRNQVGERNHMWKGRDAKYKAFHLRVKTIKGRASDFGCAICGTKDQSHWYDWANLTGKYDDIDDYLPMCRSCHRKYDMKKKKEVIGCQV